MTKIKKQKSKARIWTDRIFVALFVILLALLVFVGISLARGKTPSLFGYSVLNVKTGSMEPNISTGSLILVKNVDQDELSNLTVGEIVVYNSQYKGAKISVTHRIIENNCDEGYLITKGDANSIDDGKIEYNRVFAKYVKRLNFLTFCYKALLSFWGFLFLIILPSIILLVLYIVSIAKQSVLMKAEQETVQEQQKVEELKKQAIEEYLKNNAPPDNEEK